MLISFLICYFSLGEISFYIATLKFEKKIKFMYVCMYVTGRDFIDQLTKHIDDWNNRSPLQHLALKVAIVLLAVALQKPGQRSKAKRTSRMS